MRCVGKPSPKVWFTSFQETSCGESENQFQNCDRHLPTELHEMRVKTKSICSQNMTWWGWKLSPKLWFAFCRRDVVNRKTNSKSMISICSQTWRSESENEVQKCDFNIPADVMWGVGKPSTKVWSPFVHKTWCAEAEKESPSLWFPFAHKTWCGESENHIQKCDLHLPTELNVVSRKIKSNSVISVCLPNVMRWVWKSSTNVWLPFSHRTSWDETENQVHLRAECDVVSRKTKYKSVISFCP